MGTKKVLIIDDEEDFCLLMQVYLSRKNCEVSISNTLKEGIGQVKKNHPDIVILDNNLPDGLGWRAADNIIELSPGTHLFLISANKAQQGNWERNVAKYQVVEKPVSFSQIDGFLK